LELGVGRASIGVANRIGVSEALQIEIPNAAKGDAVCKIIGNISHFSNLLLFAADPLLGRNIFSPHCTKHSDSHWQSH